MLSTGIFSLTRCDGGGEHHVLSMSVNRHDSGLDTGEKMNFA